jgi:hypothetical protein
MLLHCALLVAIFKDGNCGNIRQIYSLSTLTRSVSMLLDISVRVDYVGLTLEEIPAVCALRIDAANCLEQFC